MLGRLSSNGISRLGCAPRLAYRGYAQHYKLKKTLEIPAPLMYSVVADVQKYSEFVPYCTGSQIVKCTNNEPSEALLTVGWDSISEEFASKLVYTPTTVEAIAADNAMFKQLSCKWTVRTLPTGGCMAALDLKFAFQNRLYNIVSKGMGPTIAKKMVQAFTARAQALAAQPARPNPDGLS